MTINPVTALRFDSSLTLKHDANSLVLPNGCDLTTAPGDRAWFWLEDAHDPETKAILIKYQTADGRIIWPAHYYGA